LFEAVTQDCTEPVLGGLAGAEALDPRQPCKALPAIGEPFVALAREEDVLGRFAPSTAQPERSPNPAAPSTGRA
jgi:TetR/AcrR family transcriptional repressor of mexJK operon